MDTLRLEVIRIGQQAFYLWPNARRLRKMSPIIGAEVISNGEYSGQAFNVFANPAIQIQFAARGVLS